MAINERRIKEVGMTQILSDLLNNYIDDEFLSSQIIPWASPILAFGNPLTARLATLGLNPSNKEFVDKSGIELSGFNKRFETLNSLDIKNWADIEAKHLNSIIYSYNVYFSNRPYDAWFKKLDFLISGTNNSYYFPYGNACHLDLSPFATSIKWGELTTTQRKYLLDISVDSLALILNESKIDIIILNGTSVVEYLAMYSDSLMEKILLPHAILKRTNSSDVMGYGFIGVVNKIGNIKLNRAINIIGYNHNVQSSFGITKDVQIALRNWIADKYISI
jgi:hypothetical protein